MKKFKIGIFGAVRGLYIAKDFMMLGCEIVAICEKRKECLKNIKNVLGSSVTVYEDFNNFIEHDMDAVVLANYFHEHTPYAIKCLEKGIHVYSECISNATMAEGVQLIKASEKSKAVYMIAENYPQMKFNREMKRIKDNGSLGKILYAEGEYIHPHNPHDLGYIGEYDYCLDHWRNFTPSTYYITHSLGPVMYITGATPKKVTAFASFAPITEDVPVAKYNGDGASVIMTQNDDGSIFKVAGTSHFAGEHNAYRICGTNGQIENLRGMGEKVMLRYNDWSIPKDMQAINLYEPEWNDPDESFIGTSGHGGGDYLTSRIFIECIEKNEQPCHPYDVHSAVAMSSVGILAHRSILEGGKTFDIPDFRNEEDCKLYENDHFSPFLPKESKYNIPCCSNPEYKPTDEQLKKYEQAIKKAIKQ